MPRVHACAICGKPFPEGTVATRKYCIECGEAHTELLRIGQRERARKRREALAAQNQKQPQKKNEITEEDRLFCAPCIFSEKHSKEHLCNFNWITCQTRGCKFGVGCTQRILPNEASKLRRVVERRAFNGSGT